MSDKTVDENVSVDKESKSDYKSFWSVLKNKCKQKHSDDKFSIGNIIIIITKCFLFSIFIVTLWVNVLNALPVGFMYLKNMYGISDKTTSVVSLVMWSSSNLFIVITGIIFFCVLVKCVYKFIFQNKNESNEL